MEPIEQPAQKPVLVSDISDDVRALRGSDLKRQKTVLTARALSDFMAGDEIKKENPSDAGYFNSVDDVLDFNLVVDASCRFVPEGNWHNTPPSAVRHDGGGNAIGLAGFLYTLAVLPNGQLQWPSSYNGVRTIANPTEANATTEPREPESGSIIRQVYWTANEAINDSDAYTRIGVYDSHTKLYSWGEWGLLSGEPLYIVIEGNIDEVINPIPNAIYLIHGCVSNFELPNANDYKIGTIVGMVQYPDEGSNPEIFASRVTYTATTAGISENYSLTMTPASNRNNAKAHEAYLDSMNPTEHMFKVVALMNDHNVQVGHTWELETEVDETCFTTGLAELLSAHTDCGVADVVSYKTRQYYEDNPDAKSKSFESLILQRPMACSGYIEGGVTKTSEMLMTDWSILVKVLDPNSDASFVTADRTGGAPSPVKMYFIKQDGRYLLASSDGFITRFESGVDYYELSSTVDSQTIFSKRGNALSLGQRYPFRAHVARDQILYILIRPGTIGSTAGDHRVARNYVDPIIRIIADPHPGSYLSKSEVNPSGYTFNMLRNLIARGEVYNASVHDPAQIPAGTGAVIGAFDYLSERLQSRGLLHGSIFMTDVSDVTIDTIRTSGNYWIVPSASQVALRRENLGFPAGFDCSKKARLFVEDGWTSSASLLHEDMEFTPTDDTEPDVSKTYYIWDGTTYTSVAIAVFEEGVTYYERDPVNFRADRECVLQTLLQMGTIPCLWYREGVQDGTTFTWTMWQRLGGEGFGQTTLETLNASDVTSFLASGKTVMDLNGAETRAALPAAENYPARTKLIFQIHAGHSCIFTYGSPATTYTFENTATDGYQEVCFVTDGSSWHHNIPVESWV